MPVDGISALFTYFMGLQPRDDYSAWRVGLLKMFPLPRVAYIDIARHEARGASHASAYSLDGRHEGLYAHLACARFQLIAKTFSATIEIPISFLTIMSRRNSRLLLRTSRLLRDDAQRGECLIRAATTRRVIII